MANLTATMAMVGAMGACVPGSSQPEAVTVTTSESAAGEDPFAGTAASFPEGAGGITLPAARAVKGFSAKEVAASLQKVRAALIAARLDTAMLVGHKPARFLAMLAPHNREGVGDWFKSGEFSSVATWIAPTAKLDPRHQPRVSGRMTYASGKVDGIQTLRVTTNFVWVYAFQNAGQPIAAQHDEITWEFTDPDDVVARDRGLWLAEAGSYTVLAECEAAKKGLLAPDPAPVSGPNFVEDPDSLLQPDHSLVVRRSC